MQVLTLARGREAASRRRHPWVFSGSLARGAPFAGGAAEVRGADGSFVGRGFASPSSPIAVRIWTFEDRPLDAALVAARLDDARHLRAAVVPPDTDGYRVVNAEGDFLPGLVVDRYGGVLSVQATTEGTEHARELWLPALRAAFPHAVVVQRNDLASRKGEGLPLEDEVLAGAAVPARAAFRERGLAFVAELSGGQKTGFFLDQRENRHLIRGLSAGRRVAAGEAWDMIVTDPPAFAKRRADVDRACRGYKDLNRLAIGLLAPGGLLLACSCSGAVDADLFQKVLFAAALDAGREVRLLEKRGAGPDHPVSIDCPEGEYLKAFLLEAAG